MTLILNLSLLSKAYKLICLINLGNNNKFIKYKLYLIIETNSSI